MLFVFCVCISVLLYLCFQMWVLGGVGIAVLLLLHFASSQKLGAGTGSGSCRAFPYRAENVSNLFWYSASFLWTFWQREGHFEVAYIFCSFALLNSREHFFLSESTFYQRTFFLSENTFFYQRTLFYQVDFFIRWTGKFALPRFPAAMNMATVAPRSKYSSSSIKCHFFLYPFAKASVSLASLRAPYLYISLTIWLTEWVIHDSSLRQSPSYLCTTVNFWSDNLQFPYSKKATRQYAQGQRKQCGNPEMAANLFSRLERFCEESQVMVAHWWIAQINNPQSLTPWQM